MLGSIHSMLLYQSNIMLDPFDDKMKNMKVWQIKLWDNVYGAEDTEPTKHCG